MLDIESEGNERSFDARCLVADEMGQNQVQSRIWHAQLWGP